MEKEKEKRKVFHVRGSYGVLTACVCNGNVLNYEPAEHEPREYDGIRTFNVREWMRQYPKEDLTEKTIDILDIGYWTIQSDGTMGQGFIRYEPPCEDWREEFREGYWKRNKNCLAGMRCSHCGSLGPFKIECRAMFTVYDDGTELSGGDVEWDNDAYCVCLNCDASGKAKDFQVK